MWPLYLELDSQCNLVFTCLIIVQLGVRETLLLRSLIKGSMEAAHLGNYM